MPILEHRRFHAASLVAEHPLRWAHPHKVLVHDIACPPGTLPGGHIEVRRWEALAPPSIPDPRGLAVEVVRGPFAYDDAPDDAMVWWPNFADHDLFAFWDGPLLAQDELQIAEHPSLAAVRKALVASGGSTATVDADGRPTPFTLQGVERRCAIDVTTGLYGNGFARAEASVIRAATRRLDPPTISHIVAMAGPVGGRGVYTTAQIDWVLTAAHTAFAATTACADGRPVHLHTGFWGCGAFGGDRVLMALLQLLAASAAGVGRVVFHTFAPEGREALGIARAHLDQLAQTCGEAPDDWVVGVHGLRRRWGVSNGT